MQTHPINSDTADGSKNVKFITNQCQVDLSIDQYDEQLRITLKSLKSRNIYQAIFDQASLPEDLKTFLSNVKTVYEYIEVNKDNPQKIILEETGRVHLVFMLSFGPNSQIKKQIILETELKEVASVQGSNIKQNLDKLRDQIIEINKKHEEERKKLKIIICSIQKLNQRLIIDSQSLKLENIQFTKKFQVIEQKVTSLEILFQDLYASFQNAKDQKKILEKRLPQTKLVEVVPSNVEDFHFKKQMQPIIQSNERETESSIIKRLRALQYERDEQKKNFQQKLAQKQRALSLKITNLQRHSNCSAPELNSDISFFQGCLKDSEIQQLKNTVCSYNSLQMSQKSQKSQNVQKSQNQFRNLCEPNIITSTSSIINGLTKKIGLTGKYYCGTKLCEERCQECRGICEPVKRENCAGCMRLDVDRRGLKKGFLVNANGQVAWLENGQFFCGIGCENGAYNCGLHDKYCQWCDSLTKNYINRYKQLI